MHEQAKAEGTVTVFSLSSRIARVEKTFETAYPGVDMVGIDAIVQPSRSPGQAAEQQAGVHAVDVLYLADAPVVLRSLLGRDGSTPMCRRAAAGRSRTASRRRCWCIACPQGLMYNEATPIDGSPVKNL